MEIKTTLEEYASIQHEIDKLEEKKEALRTIISQDLPEEGYKNEFYSATWVKRKTWKYSQRITDLTDVLKETKKAEELSGVATAEENNVLTIKIK